MVCVSCTAFAANTVTSMAHKRISPHTNRHTAAVHLLRIGVGTNTIRVWFGHVSLDMTNIYIEVDLEMKTNALAYVDIRGLPILLRRQKPPAVMGLRGNCRSPDG